MKSSLIIIKRQILIKNKQIIYDCRLNYQNIDFIASESKKIDDLSCVWGNFCCMLQFAEKDVKNSDKMLCTIEVGAGMRIAIDLRCV